MGHLARNVGTKGQGSPEIFLVVVMGQDILITKEVEEYKETNDRIKGPEKTKEE